MVPCPRDDERILERMDERGAGLGDLGQCASLVDRFHPVEQHHGRAEPLDERPLRRCDVVGNVHGGVDAEDLGGARHGGTVIARRDGDDAPWPVCHGDVRQSVEGAAELECPGSLP